MRARLLIVDDEETLLWSIVRRLAETRPQYEVETAGDGESALALLKRGPPDLLVADIRMPRISGLELVLEARRLFPSLPTVVMTAYPADDSRAEALRCGSIEYLEKPFTFDQFSTVIDDALNRASGFSGAVVIQTLPDIIQLYCLAQVSGRLSVGNRQAEGAVWFDRGAIIHATAGSLVGVAAFREVMSWSNGRFEMQAGVAANVRTIESPWMELMLDATRQFDEQQRSDSLELDLGPALEEQFETVIQPGEKFMPNAKESLGKLSAIDGYVGAGLGDAESGMLIASDGGGATINIEVAVAANTEVVRAKRKAAKTIGLKDDIEDMLITLGKQYHLIRPMRARPNVFFYLVLERSKANLALARMTLADVEREIVV